MTTLPPPPSLATSRPVLIAILAVSVLLSLVSAVLFQAPGLLGREKVLTDFDAFYVAGLMAERGQAAEAYQAIEMVKAQQEFTGTRSFMPWTYPPPYTLFVMGLAKLPIGYAYLAFMWTSFVLYLLVLRRIAGPYLPGALIAVLPVVLLIVRTGQNGFLTASLIGCVLLACREKRAVAGVPLGLMVIKPHLAVGVALLVLLERQWKAIAVAATIVLAALALATAVLGTGIWAAFVTGIGEASAFLSAGYYALFRMTSVYAAAWTIGRSAALASALHIVGVVGALGLLCYVWHSRYEPRYVAAAACVATLFVSPYNYDYDLPILGVGIAFVLSDVVARARRWELFCLLLLSWIATGYGFGASAAGEWTDTSVKITASTLTKHNNLSLGGPALIALVVACCAILRRAGSSASDGAEQISHDSGSSEVNAASALTGDVTGSASPVGSRDREHLQDA